MDVIQVHIASDEVPEAMKLLLDFVRDFSDDKEDKKEVIVISHSYNRLERQERRGVLNFELADQQRRKLLYQILDFMDDMMDRLSQNLAA